eukprot:TRINITY_DN844_c0_g6_i1.p1 TRINITY_DN844_c0_g6~~TRINITY_DN844_c0_g6_i1.p1  ORF type:complete len:437 (+),score=166.74 TRINITY_DN844_c0_g6_i1:94-1404(+)
MPGELIDGKKIAGDIRAEIAAEVARHSKKPGLAVIIVGTRKDSQTYVRLKHKFAQECGFQSFQVELPETVTQEELVAKIDECNANPEIHGMIVQLPLPKHINEPAALCRIAPEKDADGLGPENIVGLYTRGREPPCYPCTPKGIVEMLVRSGVTIEGARAAVIGRSNIVGLPVAHMLMQRNATVTICHSRTRDIAKVCSECDILVAAAGSLEMVKKDFIKPGAAVIDVGTNCVDDPSKKCGYRTVGDVAFDECREVAGHISPVPGGVGPMTIAMLLKNTLESFKRSACGNSHADAAAGAFSSPEVDAAREVLLDMTKPGAVTDPEQSAAAGQRITAARYACFRGTGRVYPAKYPPPEAGDGADVFKAADEAGEGACTRKEIAKYLMRNQTLRHRLREGWAKFNSNFGTEDIPENHEELSQEQFCALWQEAALLRLA